MGWNIQLLKNLLTKNKHLENTDNESHISILNI